MTPPALVSSSLGRGPWQELVRDCVAAMKAAVKVPVTVKHRIGIDDMQSYEELCHFVDTVHQGLCCLPPPFPNF